MKKKSTMRTGALVFVLILLIGIITAVGIGSSWFRNWDVRTWYNAWGKNNNGETVALSADGKEINAGGEYAMPKTITFLPLAVSKTGEYVPGGEITLIASLSNTFIKNKFEFSANFMESGTGWETEKNVSDYLQITPSGSDTVKLKVLAAFGAPIELTATLQGSDSAATCKIDYLKKFVGDILMVSMHNSDGGNPDFGTNNKFVFSCTLQTGTVASEDIVLADCSISLTSGFAEEVKKNLKFDITFTERVLSGACVPDSEREFSFENVQFDYSDFIKDFNTFSEQQKNAVYYAWYKGFNDAGGYPNLLMTVTAYHTYFGVSVGDNTRAQGATCGTLKGELKGKDIQPDTEFNTYVVF